MFFFLSSGIHQNKSLFPRYKSLYAGTVHFRLQILSKAEKQHCCRTNEQFRQSRGFNVEKPEKRRAY